MSSTDWASGYVTDVNYTFGYYTEMNPLQMKLLFLNSGIRYPEIKTACELGFGQGISINIHAAASNVSWWGNDFNPSQADFAIELGKESGADITLKDNSFEEFLNRDDLPGFDYIALHGIWSWISDENRKYIVDFINKNLNIGGVVYASYNTEPGWSSMRPIRDLMFEFSKKNLPAGTSTINKIDDALEFGSELLECEAGYFKNNPGIKKKFERLKTQNKNYLAHEYFDENWNPMYFHDVALHFASAKLKFACSAIPRYQLQALNFTPSQVACYNKIKDPVFKETTRDFILNTQFRKDFWVKGIRYLSQEEQLELIRGLKVVLIAPRKKIKLKITGDNGDVNLDRSIYDPILDVLDDYKPKSIGQIEGSVQNKNIKIKDIVEVLLILTGKKSLATAQENSVINKNKNYTTKLNNYFCQKSTGNMVSNFLASPVTGGGITVGRIQQLFLLQYEAGVKDINQLASYVAELTKSQGEKIISEGKPLESGKETLEYLKKQAKNFLDIELPVFKALLIKCKL